MTPQELMDLPFAGMAKKEIRRSGKWREEYTFDELLEWASGHRVMVVMGGKLVVDHDGDGDIEDSIRNAMEAQS